MKKVFGRNRLAIIALAGMIGVAIKAGGQTLAEGLSFADAGKDKKKSDKKEEKQVEVLNYEDLTDGAVSENADLVKEENPDTAAGEDVADAGNALEDGQIGDMELNGSESEIGDAVLTSAQVTSNMAVAKLTREQSRSKSKEALMDVISDEALSDDAKKEAADTYVKLSDNIEKETDVETVLAAKGYQDAIVTISDDAVDVSIGTVSLSDTEKAQIEDIVTRKTGYDISRIAISLVGSK